MADEVHAVLDAAGDDLGLARYWYLVGQRGLATCRAADLISASRQGLSHAQAAGAPGLAHELCAARSPRAASRADSRVGGDRGRGEAP